MQKISRQRRSESAWREIVERQGQSGLAVPEFCEREGIKAASLYGWRSRLREGSRSPPTPCRCAEEAGAQCPVIGIYRSGIAWHEQLAL